MIQVTNSESTWVVLTSVFVIAIIFHLVARPTDVFAQTPLTKSSTHVLPQKEQASRNTDSSKQNREAKPELILQTAENNFGVSRLVFSPDGQLLVTTSPRNGLVRLWEIATGRELRNLSSGTTSQASSPFVAFSRNSRLIATTADHQSVKIWDVITGRVVQTLAGPRAAIYSGDTPFIQFGPNDKTLIAITPTGSGLIVTTWEVGSWRELRTIELASSSVVDQELVVAITGDARQLAAVVSGAASSVVITFDLTTGKEVHSFLLANQPIKSAAASFTSDGELFVSAVVDRQWRLWQTSNQKERVLDQTTDDYCSLQFSRDGRLLALAQENKVKLWDVTKRHSLTSLLLPKNEIGASQSPPVVSFSDDGRSVATSGLGRPTTVLETKSGKQLLRLNGRTNAAYNVNFSHDGTRLFSGGRTSWDVRTGHGARLITGLPETMFALPSPDGRLVAAYVRNTSALAIFESSTGRQIRALTSTASIGAIQQLKFSRDGALLVSTYERVEPQSSSRKPPRGTELKIWDLKTAHETSRITLKDKAVDEAFTANGRILVTLDSMGQLAWWDTATGARIQNEIAQSVNTTERITSLSFSFDDQTLATGSVGEVSLWNVANGRRVGNLKTQPGAITQLNFSRDGRLLAASCENNAIQLWDVTTLTELRSLVGHTVNINSLDFSPKSELLASASDDGSTFLWDTRTGEHVLTLVSLDDGAEWVTATPQGLFDGTPVSWNQILWRYNQDTFNVAPIEWFFNEFYYPGMLADVFLGKRPRVRDDISTKDRRQPLLKLSLVYEQPQPIDLRQVKVRIKVTDALPDKENSRGCGARDLRLFRNGSLIKVWHGDVLNGQTAVTLEENVTLIAGVNRLTAYAFNRDNVKSKDAHLSLTGSDSLKRSGTTYILAVGLNEYANAQYNLKYAVADAQSFSAELRKEVSQVSPSGRIEIIPLINQNATKANILSALAQLSGDDRSSTKTKLPELDRLKRAEPEDTIVIYFAGHGTARGQRFYLIPYDLGYTGERSELTEQALNTILSHSISDIELEQALENVEANHLLLFIDACNSGQALETEEKRRGPMNSKGLAQLAYEKGMYILTAAQSYQAALEVAQLGHGLLTYALVEDGLKTENADSVPKDGVLTAREWLDFATERVPQLQEDKIKETRGLGLELSFTEGDQSSTGNASLQRPRSFYRRELETNPLVIAGERTNLNSRVAPAATSTNVQVGANTLARWIDLQTATLVTRYRWIQDSAGVTTANNLQDQMQFRGRFKFDKVGAYSLNAGVFTGNSFINGFNDTGIGTGRAVTNLYLKQLFLSAKPINGVEVQYGGLYFQRGESSEITTYDNDGYLVGERIIIQRPRDLFFDELSATFAFIGDQTTPNINKRWHRLKESNYHQFLATKRIGERAVLSGDYTFQSGNDTLHQAVRINTPEFRAIDFLRIEVYERLANNPDAGLAAYVEKTFISKRLTVGGGYAQIDRDFGGLNGDRFNRGKRFFFNGSYRLTPEFTISTFYTHAFKNDFPVINRTRFEVLFSYNLLRSLQRTKLF